ERDVAREFFAGRRVRLEGHDPFAITRCVETGRSDPAAEIDEKIGTGEVLIEDVEGVRFPSLGGHFGPETGVPVDFQLCTAQVYGLKCAFVHFPRPPSRYFFLARLSCEGTTPSRRTFPSLGGAQPHRHFVLHLP